MNYSDCPIYEVSSFASDSQRLSIVVTGREPNSFHSGIMFKHDDSCYVLHLASHQQLLLEQITNNFENYYWVKTSLEKSRQESVSAMCRRIFKRQENKKMPYALFYKSSVFNQDGSLRYGENEIGFTCAHFILAVYNSCRIQLIDTNDWVSRKDDSKFQTYIIDVFKKVLRNADEHIDNLSNEIGCFRFRPEEVTASSTFKEIPASKYHIIARGKNISSNVLNNKKV